MIITLCEVHTEDPQLGTYIVFMRSVWQEQPAGEGLPLVPNKSL